ncbi:MAG: TIGR00282 family metallophosphoesterase [Planctomycetota bacterium]|nr:TIGR00282 family metallophosphoesterase [Planctomycetota bacterium]
MSINILCIGDVVGRCGRSAVAELLPELVQQRKIDLVVCNAENTAGGSGLTPTIFNKLLHYGVDVVTLGDHVYRRREITESLGNSERIVRPANISTRAVGRRWTVVPTKSGKHQVAVACLLGQMFMKPADSPWAAAERIFAEIPEAVKIRIIDFHAEASSEKIAMGWHCNGRASVVFGTHTHIPTADARVLDKGTAYISDVGMTGPYDGVLGRLKDRVLYSLTTSMPTPFQVAKNDVRLCGAVAAVDPATGRAESIERIEIKAAAQTAGETGVQSTCSEGNT